MSRQLELFGVGTVALATGAGLGAFFALKCFNTPLKVENPYETEKIVNEYMAFHYASSSEYLPWTFGPSTDIHFPVRCAQLCLKHKASDVPSTALDVGCAVGRTSFELAREYKEVLGIDYSAALVAKCQQLKDAGQACYKIMAEGDLCEERIAQIDTRIDRSRVCFSRGDACNLDGIGQFGCVFAGNLVCRLQDPAKFLHSLKALVQPGGILVLTSPFTWLEQYTPKDRWLGGFWKDGQQVQSLDNMKQILQKDFDLVEEEDLPFLIRETRRKYQWVVAHATVWKKRPYSGVLRIP